MRAVTNTDYAYWARQVEELDIVDSSAVGELEIDTLIYNMNNVYLTYLKSDGTDLTVDELTKLSTFMDSVKTSQAHIVYRNAKKLYIQVPFAGTIVGWRLISDVSTIATVDVWKANGTIPTVANTITASAKPALSSATVASSTTLTGWSTAVAVGDIFELNVDSNSASAVLNLFLDIEVS
jgi:hypothetical protein